MNTYIWFTSAYGIKHNYGGLTLEHKVSRTRWNQYKYDIALRRIWYRPNYDTRLQNKIILGCMYTSTKWYTTTRMQLYLNLRYSGYGVGII